jgi:hypothetical protein
MSRRYKATRYDEKNCKPQCEYCNNYLHGQQWLFGHRLDKQYGAGTAATLFKKTLQAAMPPSNEDISHWENVVIEKLDYLSKTSWQGPVQL